MADERGKELFFVTNKITNMLDTGKTIESRGMDRKSGSKLRISPILCPIKAIFIRTAMRKKEQFNTKMAQNIQETLSTEWDMDMEF